MPSPIYGDGRLYLASAHGSQSLVFAVVGSPRDLINLRGGQTDGLAWIVLRTAAYMATPLLMDDLLYVVRWNGILVCIDPNTGEIVYEKRLRSGTYTASPVGGDGKLYVANEEGDVLTFERAARLRFYREPRLPIRSSQHQQFRKAFSTSEPAAN